MAIYKGSRWIQGTEYRHVTKDGRELHPTASQKLWNHSPDGFEWGYQGSGPAQLALAILLEETTKDMALDIYQAFKRDVIANFDRCTWTLTSDQVQDWLHQQRQKALEIDGETGST